MPGKNAEGFDLVILRRTMLNLVYNEREAAGETREALENLPDDEQRAIAQRADEQAREIMALPPQERAAREEAIRQAAERWAEQRRQKAEAARVDAERAERKHEIALAAALRHATGCWRPAPRHQPLGPRVTGELVELLRCPECGAWVRLVDGELEEALSEEPTADPASTDLATDAAFDAAPSSADSPQATRRPGRPKGSRLHGCRAIVARFRELKASTGRNPTQPELAANLKPPVEVRTLQDYLAEYDLPWPIE